MVMFDPFQNDLYTLCHLESSYPLPVLYELVAYFHFYQVDHNHTIDM